MPAADEALRQQFAQEFWRLNQFEPSPLIPPAVEREGGTVEAAAWVVDLGPEASGLARLWDQGRLRRSVEALVVEPKFERLFTPEVRRQALANLTAYHYPQHP